MPEFIYYSADWCQPCKMIYPKVLAWAVEFDVKLTKIDMSDGFFDGIMSVPTLDVIVNGIRRLRITQWGPQTKHQVAAALAAEPPEEPTRR